MQNKIESIIRETLVIENKASLHHATGKLKTLIENNSIAFAMYLASRKANLNESGSFICYNSFDEATIITVQELYTQFKAQNNETTSL